MKRTRVSIAESKVEIESGVWLFEQQSIGILNESVELLDFSTIFSSMLLPGKNLNHELAENIVLSVVCFNDLFSF